jgi:toxin-antitoxin system PIN domain toxin
VFVADTNVLVYAADRDSPHHARCFELLEGWRRSSASWFITWAIAYEFLRVISHPRVLRRPWPVAEAWSFVDAVLASPGLEVLVATPRHATVARQTLAELPHLAGNLLHDAHTAILMREHGVRRIYTRDTDFHRFGFVEPLDPLTADGPRRPR